MKKYLPKRDVKPVLADIRRGGGKDKFPEPPKKLNRLGNKAHSTSITLSRPKPPSSRKVVFWISVILLVVAFLTGLGVWRYKKVEASREKVGVSATGLFKMLAPAAAAQPAFLSQSSNLWQEIISSFDSLESSISSFNNLGDDLTNLETDLDNLKSGWFDLLFSSDGPGLIPLAQKTSDDLKVIAQTNASLTKELKISNGSNLSFFDAELNLNNAREASAALLNLLKDGHIAVVFEDSSELRPTGGKIVSYADVYLKNGRVLSITINPITKPDGLLTLKIAPPVELSAEKTWSAGEANWFLDFPSSAREIISFLNASALYKNRGVEFAGLVSMDSKALTDFLSDIDPSLMPGAPADLTTPSYLKKAIPQALAEESSSTAPSAKLWGDLEADLENKDLMIYFTDQSIENFISANGLSGSVFNPPYNFNGDYLSVVNVNPTSPYEVIALNQNVALKSQIDLSGTVTDNLTLTNSYEFLAKWYRGNQSDWVNVFTLPQASLISLSGNTPTLNPISNYLPRGYSTDPTLSAVENSVTDLGQFNAQSFVENGLNVFSAWFDTPVTAARELNLIYTAAHLAPPTVGERFEFVMDREPGVNQSLNYSVAAPPGFVWRENGLPIWSLEESNLPGRTDVVLTLKKND